MAGDGDKLLAALANGLGQGGAADLGDGAIDDAGVFIEDDALAERRGSEQQGQRDAELLAGGQHAERSQPRRW